MLCFKFNQNHTINEDFYFWRGGGGGGKILSESPEGSRGTRLQKFEKSSYRKVVPTHTENFSNPAQLESV